MTSPKIKLSKTPYHQVRRKYEHPALTRNEVSKIFFDAWGEGSGAQLLMEATGEVFVKVGNKTVGRYEDPEELIKMVFGG